MDKTDPAYLSLVKMLSENKGGFVSAEAISSTTGIPTKHVLKSIAYLRRQGYIVEYKPDIGFRLGTSADGVASRTISKLLHTSHFGVRDLIYLRSATSTQALASELADTGAPHGTVVIAKKQTSSVGRMGRKWVSPLGGLWMSVIIRPKFKMHDSGFLSLVAPVSVSTALDRVTSLQVGLKWPNDVIIRGRKVAGILIDLNAADENVSYAIIGIGINANFRTSELAGKYDHTESNLPTTLLDESGRLTNLLTLASSVLNSLENDYLELERDLASKAKPVVLHKWKAYDETLGRNVVISQGDQITTGFAQDISDRGALMVKLEDGSIREFNSGTLRFI